jgi:hypothetical protein
MIGIHKPVLLAVPPPKEATQPPIGRVQSMRSVAFESREAVRSDLALERSRTKNADMPSLNFMVGIAQSPTYPLRKKTGNARREDTARFYHALDFTQKSVVVGDVLKNLRTDHPIESGIRKR